MSSNDPFVGRGPSLLRYNGAVGCPNALVEKRSGLERDAWRCAPHQVDIVRDIPCALTVYDPVVLEEVLGRRATEQEHEVFIRVLASKRSSDEPVDEEVTGGGNRMSDKFRGSRRRDESGQCR
jgi:hypothetical protein